MSAEHNKGCTCWRIPDLRGVPQPVGWLMLHELVVVSMTSTDNESARLRTGQLLGAGRDSGDPGELYIVLEERPGNFWQITSDRIAYVEPVATPDQSTLTQILGLREDFVASLGTPPEPNGPSVGRFHRGDREYLEVRVRRGQHECAPGPPLP